MLVMRALEMAGRKEGKHTLPVCFQDTVGKGIISLFSPWKHWRYTRRSEWLRGDGMAGMELLWTPRMAFCMFDVS